jgi:hypothetical protein
VWYDWDAFGDRSRIEKNTKKWYILWVHTSNIIISGRLAQLGERSVRKKAAPGIPKMLILPEITIISATYIRLSFQS